MNATNTTIKSGFSNLQDIVEVLGRRIGPRTPLIRCMQTCQEALLVICRYPRILLPLAVTLFSISAMAQTSVTPTSLAFGNHVIGTTSASRNVTLVNRTRSALTLNSVTTANADFIITSNNCGSSVGPYARCAIRVAFQPSIQGSENATLTINDSVGSPQTVSLTGNGTASLSSISITPSNPAVAQGGTQQFTATGTYNDGTTKDLTSTVSWVSSRRRVASIAAGGWLWRSRRAPQ